MEVWHYLHDFNKQLQCFLSDFPIFPLQCNLHMSLFKGNWLISVEMDDINISVIFCVLKIKRPNKNLIFKEKSWANCIVDCINNLKYFAKIIVLGKSFSVKKYIWWSSLLVNIFGFWSRLYLAIHLKIWPKSVLFKLEY